MSLSQQHFSLDPSQLTMLQIQSVIQNILAMLRLASDVYEPLREEKFSIPDTWLVLKNNNRL